jgi:hypothetical protein
VTVFAEARVRAERERVAAEEAPGADRETALLFLDRIQALFPEHEQLAELTVAEPGPCEECETEASRRYRLGVFSLCRRCTLRRVEFGARLAAQVDTSAVSLSGIARCGSVSPSGIRCALVGGHEGPHPWELAEARSGQGDVEVAA